MNHKFHADLNQHLVHSDLPKGRRTGPCCSLRSCQWVLQQFSRYAAFVNGKANGKRPIKKEESSICESVNHVPGIIYIIPALNFKIVLMSWAIYLILVKSHVFANLFQGWSSPKKPACSLKWSHVVIARNFYLMVSNVPYHIS